MPPKQRTVQKLYRNLLGLYPRAFRECLGESMQQTFNDLYNERKQQPQPGLFGFVVWMFMETGAGIVREQLLLLSPGDMMRTITKTFGTSALIGFLLILPLLSLEIINRRSYGEDFPFMLFFLLWFNLFSIILVLLPFARVLRAGSRAAASPAPAQPNTLLTNPRSAALISIGLLLATAVLPLLDWLGWVSADAVINGPDPEQEYLPGLFIMMFLYSLTVAAVVIACGPVVRTLQAGGSLFAHPFHLILVVIFVSVIAFGVGSLIIDQWPCFMGVRMCD